MPNDIDFGSAGAGFEDSGFWDREDATEAFVSSLLQFTSYGDGYDAATGVHAEDEGVGQVEGDVVFHPGLELPFEQPGDVDYLLGAAQAASPPASPAPSEALSTDSAISLTNSLDDVGANILYTKLWAPPAVLTTSNYTPLPHILAQEPESPPDHTAIYAPLTTLHFRTSAEAKAHRRRPRIHPKSDATDIARVKTFGRAYWVRRIYNAMIDISAITDKPASVHRQRFTQRSSTPAFEALDLEATAHHVFDEAIAVHERGFNRPKVYYKNTVRGKLVDISEKSVELRLSRICLVLRETKSTVDDALRGGVTLALLCDNPEARRFTKASNDAGNAKRGERLKVTATKERVRKAKAEEDEGDVEGDGREEVEVQEE